jgi:hypothetical protein
MGLYRSRIEFWSCLKLFNTVYNENVQQKWWIKKIKNKKGGRVHKSGTYGKKVFFAIKLMINMCGTCRSIFIVRVYNPQPMVLPYSRFLPRLIVPVQSADYLITSHSQSCVWSSVRTLVFKTGTVSLNFIVWDVWNFSGNNNTTTNMIMTI